MLTKVLKLLWLIDPHVDEESTICCWVAGTC